MTLIDPRIVTVLGVHRWKTMGVSSVECECGQILYGPEGLTEFPADEAFRGHIADALAPLIAGAAADAARAEVARLRTAAEPPLAHLEQVAQQVREQGDVRQVLLEEDGVSDAPSLGEELWLIGYNLRAALTTAAPPTDEAKD